MRTVLLITCLLFTVISQAAQPKLTLIYNQESDRESSAPYIKQLLIEALASQNINAELSPSLVIYPQLRAFHTLANSNELDIYWSMTSQRRERDVEVVRIPLLKGMLGMRLFVINAGDVRLNQVSKFEDLKPYRFGQGHDWPDTAIIESAGLQVFKTTNYAGLMAMLNEGRFDIFPLGMQEIWSEVEKRPHLKVEIEPRLMIYYPSPVFVFVNPQKPELAQQLNNGLQQLINSGRFDAIFNRYYADIVARTQLNQRIIIRLQNRHMSPATRDIMQQSKRLLIVEHEQLKQQPLMHNGNDNLKP